MNYLWERVLGTADVPSSGWGEINVKYEDYLQFYVLELTADETVL
jgi:hypothetical protein